MKVLLDIKKEKAAFFLDLLRDISYVKATPLTEQKATLLAELKEAVEEMKQVKAGKKVGRKVEDLLKEL